MSPSKSDRNKSTNTFPSTKSQQLSDPASANMADPFTNENSNQGKSSAEEEADTVNRTTLAASVANPCTSLIHQSLRASPAQPQLSLSKSVGGVIVGSTGTVVRRLKSIDVEHQTNEEEQKPEQSTDDAITAKHLSVSSDGFEDLMPHFLEVDEETRQAMVADARSKKKAVQDSPPPPPPRSSNELLRSSLDSFLRYIGINSGEQREMLENAQASTIPPPAPTPPPPRGSNFARLKKSVRFLSPRLSDVAAVGEADRPPVPHIPAIEDASDKIKALTNKLQREEEYPLRLLVSPKCSLDRCVYDNLFHDHDHTIDAENSVQRSVAFIHAEGSCKCFASKYGFEIFSCGLTHGEGRLNVNISNPYCMICAKRISYVLDRTLTHIKPHTVYLRSSSSSLREDARTMSLTAQQICGQSFHSNCLANMIKNDIREGRQSVCPSCKGDLPVQQMSVIQRLGSSVGRIFSSLTGLRK